MSNTRSAFGSRSKGPSACAGYWQPTKSISRRKLFVSNFGTTTACGTALSKNSSTFEGEEVTVSLAPA